ncbi:MAG: hypothetical protein ABSB42_21555 [Tepidisphaeraceae bacterium]|jgi:uncharacterized protein YggE
MLQRHKIPAIAVAMVLILCARPVRGDDSEATVTVSGHAMMAFRETETLRMRLMIWAQGSDIHDALAKLKAQRDYLNVQLREKAGPCSTNFSDPIEGLEGYPTLQQRIVQQMMAHNQRSASTEPSGATISCNLTAEWSLPVSAADDARLAASDLTAEQTLHTALADDALAAAVALEDKIKAAIPKRGANLAETPEERKIADEMAAQQEATGVSKPDEPHFLFVHELTDDERAKLLREAFASARLMAQDCATAADKSLSKVTRISTSNSCFDDVFRDAYLEAKKDAATGSPSPSTDDWVAFGTQRNNVAYSVTMTVTFELR